MHGVVSSWTPIIYFELEVNSIEWKYDSDFNPWALLKMIIFYNIIAHDENNYNNIYKKKTLITLHFLHLTRVLQHNLYFLPRICGASIVGK